MTKQKLRIKTKLKKKAKLRTKSLTYAKCHKKQSPSNVTTEIYRKNVGKRKIMLFENTALLCMCAIASSSRVLNCGLNY